MTDYMDHPVLADLMESVSQILDLNIPHFSRDDMDEALADVELAGLYEIKALAIAIEKQAERACLTAQIIVAELQARLSYLNNYTARREGVYESTQQMFQDE